MDSRGQIENLLAKYCRLYDEGDLDGYADLFEHATISDTEEIVKFHHSHVYFYDGAAKVPHITTTIELDINEEASTADGAAT